MGMRRAINDVISILLYLRASCPSSSSRNHPSKTAPAIRVYFACNVNILKRFFRKKRFSKYQTAQFRKIARRRRRQNILRESVVGHQRARAHGG